MRLPPGVVALAILLVAMPGSPRNALAQAEAGAQSLLINPSVRSAGMGYSGVSVFWGDDTNEWANPALLGLRRGIQYEWGKTRLVPDLAADVYYRSNRIFLAAYGIGVAVSGKPWDRLGGQRLDYGVSVATDPDGNPLGEFTSFEEIRSLGVGASLGGLARAVMTFAGARTPDILRRVDVAFGHTWKDVTVDLAPAEFTQGSPAGRGSTHAKDRGLLLRLTPYDSMHGDDWLPGLERTLRGRLELGIGRSEQSYDGNSISYIDADQADPLAELVNRGVSWHAEVTLASAERASHPWYLDFISPLVSVGGAVERVETRIRGRNALERIEHRGVELVLANIFTIRRGSIDDPTGTIQDDTSGWGVGLRYAGIAGVRYDRATVPQSRYLDERVKRNGVTAFVDPVALWKRLR